MTHPLDRFASDDVFRLEPTQSSACRLARLSNATGQPLDPARLVALIDDMLEEALEELPLVLWEAEDAIRFELADTRVLLALSDGLVPGEYGVTLGLSTVGPDSAEIATALTRLLTHALMSRFACLEPVMRGQELAHDSMIDADIAAILAQPLTDDTPGLPPVEVLVDQVWQRADAQRQAPRGQAAPKAAPQRGRPAPLARLMARLPRLDRLPVTLPQLAPMRQPVRALAMMLFVLGMVQGPLGMSASAQTPVSAER